jgi:DNA-binding PadR family transcriptional regulator
MDSEYLREGKNLSTGDYLMERGQGKGKGRNRGGGRNKQAGDNSMGDTGLGACVGGRGRGRRRRRVINFLQPCLLTMLQKDEAHGYELMSQLTEFGFDLENLDPSLVYRALREMEADGLVVSEWGDESQGPQRRVYRITDDGNKALDIWIEDLHRTRDEIDRLLTARQKVK